MSGIGRKHRGAVARLAVFGLLFQAFFAALHLPGIASAHAAAAAGLEGALVICSGGGLRQIPAEPQDQRPDGSGSAPDFINCPICLTLSSCALAMPAAAAADMPARPQAALLAAAAPDAMRDHREAIRPGHDPPASL
jgi:hypothetical protein